MKNTISAIALAAALSLGGAAFAQPSGGPDAKGNAPLKHAHTVNDGSAKNGANSFTEGQAREHIEKSGFTSVTGLSKGDDGVWRGTAMKGGASVNVAMDFKGNVTTAGPAGGGAMSTQTTTRHHGRHAAAAAAAAPAMAPADTSAATAPATTDTTASTTTTTTHHRHHGGRHHRMHGRHHRHHGRGHHRHHHGMSHAMRGGSDGGMVAASGVSSNDSGISDKEQAARGQAPQ